MCMFRIPKVDNFTSTFPPNHHHGLKTVDTKSEVVQEENARIIFPQDLYVIPPPDDVHVTVVIFIIESIACLALAALVYMIVQRFRFTKTIAVEVRRENEGEAARVGEIISCKIGFQKEELQDEQNTLIELTDADKEQIQNLTYFEAIVASHPNKSLQVLQCNSSGVNEPLVIKFSARTAGFCDLYIKMGLFGQKYGINFINSPITFPILPGRISPDHSYLELYNDNVMTIVCGNWHEIPICPKDQYGNNCLLDEVDLSKFRIEFKSFSDTSEVDLENIEANFVRRTWDDNGNSKEPFYCVKVRSTKCQIFKARVLYGDQELGKTSPVDIICISVDEEMTVKENLLSYSFLWWKTPIAYEARLVAIGSELQVGRRVLFIRVYPRNLFVSHVRWDYFYENVYTYQTSKRTRISYNGVDTNSSNMWLITISDGIQVPITLSMDESEARIVMMTFYHYQGISIKFFKNFAMKKAVFQEELVGIFPYIRLKYKVLLLNKGALLQTLKRETSKFKPNDWTKQFVIAYEGEVWDKSKPKSSQHTSTDWLKEVCNEIFRANPSLLFSIHQRSKYLHPTTSSTRSPEWSIDYYELAGKILAKCLCEKASEKKCLNLIQVHFTRSFLAQLIGLPVNYKHFETDDPYLYHKKLKPLLGADLSSEEQKITFTDTDEDCLPFSHKTVNLIPNGSSIAVTNANKLLYLNSLAHYRLAYKVSDEVSAFRDGLYQVIPQSLFTHFDENDLELLLSGSPTFDIDDLKAHHRFQTVTDNFQENHVWTDQDRKRIQKWFWTSLSNMNDEERHNLLSFVTGSSIVPTCGFKNLRPWFTLVINGTTGSLPVSFPAKHELILSDQVNYEEFDRLLLLAIAKSKDKSDVCGGSNEQCPVYNFSSATSTSGLSKVQSTTEGNWCSNICSLICPR